MTDSWEELSLVSASPKLLHKGIEGVVMKQIAAATKKGRYILIPNEGISHLAKRQQQEIKMYPI